MTEQTSASAKPKEGDDPIRVLLLTSLTFILATVGVITLSNCSPGRASGAVAGVSEASGVGLERAVVARTLLKAPVRTHTDPKRYWDGWLDIAPADWRASDVPGGWMNQAVCIHEREGAWNAATGNGYEGGMQFLASTYASVGGKVIDKHGRRLHYKRWRFDGEPAHWASLDTPREQLFRAYLVYIRDGHSWREWGTALRCGLR